MMFVRWKRTKRKNEKWFNRRAGEKLTAVLVKSERIDGKPRQRYVKYLGTISENYTTYGYHPVGFWRRVDHSLAALGLDSGEIERITKQIEQTVPRPTQEYLQKQQEALANLMATAKRL